MSPRFYGIALRKVRHDDAGERFVVILRDRAGDWHTAAEYGELDGEASWAALADHGLWSERIALLLDHARERYRPPGSPEAVGPSPPQWRQTGGRRAT